jgi:hypothetical protein
MAILLGFLGLYNTTIISYKFRMKKNLGEKMIKLTKQEALNIWLEHGENLESDTKEFNSVFANKFNLNGLININCFEKIIGFKLDTDNYNL